MNNIMNLFKLNNPIILYVTIPATIDAPKTTPNRFAGINLYRGIDKYLAIIFISNNILMTLQISTTTATINGLSNKFTAIYDNKTDKNAIIICTDA